MCRRMRASQALLAALALLMTAGAATVTAQPRAAGAAVTTSPIERFTFTAPDAPAGPADPKALTLSILRWSTDAERDRLVQGATERGVERMLEAISDSSTVGYLRWPGGLEYSVRYGRRTPRADGGQDLLLVVDRPLWVWWNTSLAANATRHPFEVVHVRFDKSGKGEGRVADPSAISVDKSAGVAIANLDTRPVLMTDVRRDATS